MVLWNKVTMIGRLIVDLQNNAKATKISKKAGGMPKPREWDRLITSILGLAFICNHNPSYPDNSQLPH